MQPTSSNRSLWIGAALLASAFAAALGGLHASRADRATRAREAIARVATAGGYLGRPLADHARGALARATDARRMRAGDDARSDFWSP